MSKRAILPALMTSLLLLTACGNGGAAEETLEKQRDALAAAEQISFTAEVTANLGNEVFLCTLACAATPEEIGMEVLEPAAVAGVRATLRNGEAILRYDGVQLSVGAPGAEVSGPLWAVPLLFTALKTGHIIRAWTEHDGDSDLLTAEIYAGDDYALTVWFSAATLAPVRASLSREGTELIRCAIRDFAFA